VCSSSVAELAETGVSIGRLPEHGLLVVKTKSNTFWLVQDSQDGQRFVAETTHPDLAGVQHVVFEGATLENQSLGSTWICEGARIRMRLSDKRVLVTSPVQSVRILMDPERVTRIRREAVCLPERV